jgi:hypothetical protein
MSEENKELDLKNDDVVAPEAKEEKKEEKKEKKKEEKLKEYTAKVNMHLPSGKYLVVGEKIMLGKADIDFLNEIHADNVEYILE